MSGGAVPVETPVSKTGYYCAGTRMLDARRPDSLIHDTYAERFMGEEGKAVFDGFRHLSIPIGAHQVRCHLIDGLVRTRLEAKPDTLVVLVGAGFDSRAFRLRVGRWLEIDDKGVIGRKEAVAPSGSCPNPLSASPSISIGMRSPKLWRFTPRMRRPWSSARAC